MSQRLLVIAGPDLGRSFPLTPGVPLPLGRGKTSATHLSDPFVSKMHCQVEWQGAEPILVDQGSTSGTFVNGMRVTRQLLTPGAIIRIGETQLRVEDPDAEASSEDQTLYGAPAPAQVEPPMELVGKTLGHYAVGPMLTRGRSGVIFHARDLRDPREVALKVLLPEFSRDDEAVQRLVRAMKTMLPLRHPNLVAIYGAGRTGDYCWVAMEFVVGESLASMLRRAGKLDWRLALRVADHLTRGLEYAHEQGVVHRNIAPDNVLVHAADQTAKLGDLVLVKAETGFLAESVTRSGEFVGELEYMSPERTVGEADMDGRADLYSLGALLYAVLAGRPPLQGNTLGETLEMIRTADPAPVATHQPAVPADFAAAVHRLLSKSPEDRFQNAGELLPVLQRIAMEHGVAV